MRALSAFAGSLLIAAGGVGSADEILATPEAIRDLMVQNACTDTAGKVLVGHSPADGDPACVAQRDLRLGERLPYHKHDHPSPDQRGTAPFGYQRHDSYPVATAAFGTVVEHSFDFGAGQGRRFGAFDSGSDGGDIVTFSPGAASIAATEDGGAGFQLFVGECRGAVEPASLMRSWIIAEFDLARPAPLAGETVARLKDLKVGEQEACPARFSRAFTRWHVAPFRYRAAPGQGASVTLATLVSEHYAGGDPATADSVERFYFTRELGGTRWEAWRNARGNAQFDAGKIAAAAAAFGASGRCSAADPPSEASFLLIDCREWTLIRPPQDPAGDPAGFFLDALRARRGVPGFFAAPSERN